MFSASISIKAFLMQFFYFRNLSIIGTKEFQRVLQSNINFLLNTSITCFCKIGLRIVAFLKNFTFFLHMFSTHHAFLRSCCQFWSHLHLDYHNWRQNHNHHHRNQYYQHWFLVKHINHCPIYCVVGMSWPYFSWQLLCHALIQQCHSSWTQIQRVLIQPIPESFPFTTGKVWFTFKASKNNWIFCFQHFLFPVKKNLCCHVHECKCTLRRMSQEN
jgi:hypothetical protein